MGKIHHILLILIFCLALGTRLFLSFSTENFSSDNAYLALRQIEHIQETGSPLFADELSFSGRTTIFPPLFGYIIAGLGMAFPINFAAKFFPSLFASSTVFLAYLISRRASGMHASLLAAFISGFVPIFMMRTINSISAYSIVIPLFFVLIYAFLNLQNERWAYCYIASIAALSLIHPSAMLFVAGLWVYMLLLKAEGIEPEKRETEILVFSTFFVFLTQFIIFKKVFLFHGPLAVWQNIPSQMLSLHFSGMSFQQAFYFIGIVPFICGIYVIYRQAFREKKKEVSLIAGFIFSVAFLLWLRLIELEVGLMFLGVLMAVLFAQFWQLFSNYIKSTKAAGFMIAFSIMALILLIFTSVVPAISISKYSAENAVSDDEVSALEWIMENTSQDAVIMASVNEGSLVASIAKRKNVIDTNFLMIPDAEQRFGDVRKAFTSLSLTEAVGIMNKYGASYIYFSPKSQETYGIKSLAYLDESCFFEAYSGRIRIYRLLCRMEEIK